jgi:anti-sigma regulatory factor (Ser/Thr protein kinase)
MGVLIDARFDQGEVAIGRGDVLLVHSDGVTDAMAPDGERIGREALITMLAVKARRHATAAGTLHALRRDLLKRASLNDDLTILLARVGDCETYMDAARSLTEIARVRKFVSAAAALAGVEDEVAGLFCVAVVEAFTNIVRHAVDMPVGASIGLRARLDRGMLEIALESLGAAYEPPQTVPETQYDEFPEGGMGLEIMQRACDLVDYAHIDGVNLTRLAVDIEGR